MKQHFKLRRRCKLGATAVAIIITALFSSTIVQAADSSLPVTVYKHVNFNGKTLSVGEGEVTIRDIRRSVGNDRISSISIEPGYSVLACKHSRLRGRCETFTSDVSDLRTISFNDVISSLSISKSAPSLVTVFQHVNFKGNSLGIEQVGDITIQDLRNSRVGNDVISSIEITDGYSVRACEHSRSGGSGRCETFTDSILDLRTIGFNDTISFLSVTEDSVEPEPNRAPEASDLSLQTTADTPVQFTLAELQNIVTDADGDLLTIAVDVDNNSGNDLTQNVDTFTFDPRTDFADLPLGEQVTVSFTYSVEDPEGASDAASITISVEGVVPEPEVVFTASVRVTEPDGDLITGVNVSDALTGEQFGVTDADGIAVFEIPNTAEQMNLRLTADGYGDQITPLLITNGAASAVLNITMIERIFLGSPDFADVGFGFEFNTGNSLNPIVSWDEDSFVTASGDPVRDFEIRLMYTTVDVSNAAELEAFPGSFTGMQPNGSSTSIASLGTSEYVFVTRDGSELQLADGATADISLPLYIDTRPDTGETISIDDSLPIWSLNESTGVWIQETTGTVVASNSSPTGMAVEATVTHFSWWNIDVPIPTGSVTINVASSGLDGTVSVTATPSNVAFRTGSGSVPIGGSYSTVIPAGSDYCFSGLVRLSSGQTTSTNTVCSNVASGGNAQITLDILGLDAPLTIAADRPIDNSGNVSINGFAGAPAPRVRISTSSIESNVTYTSTNLPDGISLIATSDIAAELVGIPTADGSINVVVTGTNSDGETDSVSVQYEISADPGQLELTAILFGSFEENVVSLNDLDEISIAADSWAVIGPDPFPVGLEFDGSTGEFFISFEFLFQFEPGYWDWVGVIRGTFPGGSVVDYNVTFIYR